MSSHNENQQPIKLIKCLYNTSTHSEPLRFSDKYLYAYKDLYEEELNYNGKKFSLDPKIINLVEELGLHKSGDFETYLAFRLVPEELKEYIVVGFVEGTKKVHIDYDKAFANILHKELSGHNMMFAYVKSVGNRQLDNIHNNYNRIKYIKEKYEELMTQTLDKAYEYPFVCVSEAILNEED